MSEEKTPLEQIDRLLSGHLGEYRFRQVWEGLIFHPDGLARLTSILGWIRGVKLCGKEGEAEAYAASLFNALSNLNRIEKVEAPDNNNYLRTLTAIYDDGSLHNFAFGRYAFLEGGTVELERLNKRQKEEGLKDVVVLQRELSPYPAYLGAIYTYQGNGGVIYRGPGMGEPFSVSVADNPPYWSIHT